MVRTASGSCPAECRCVQPFRGGTRRGSGPLCRRRLRRRFDWLFSRFRSMKHGSKRRGPEGCRFGLTNGAGVWGAPRYAGPMAALSKAERAAMAQKPTIGATSNTSRPWAFTR